MSSTIVDIRARQILDSRGNPTVEVDVELADGSFGRAAVPSGASTGVHEALELRDGDKSKYLGKGVLTAVDNVNTKLADELCGMNALDQIALDYRMNELDGSENKKNLGANAILGVSLANARAAADHVGLPLFRYLGGVSARLLPAPMMNIINGGSHADNAVDVQEFMVMPLGVESFSDAIRCGCEVFHNLKKPCLQEQEALDQRRRRGRIRPRPEEQRRRARRDRRGHRQGRLRAGQAGLHRAGPGRLRVLQRREEASTTFDGKEIDLPPTLVDIYAKWVEKYPICSIEDGFAEDDWDGWKLITERLGDKIQLVGDDLFVTNTKRLQRGIDDGVANSILIKVNQIGTLDRNDRGHRVGPSQRLLGRHQPSQRRDRRLDDRRPGRGVEHRPDQDRLGLADRPHGEVQPVAPDRRDLGRGRPVRRTVVPQEAIVAVNRDRCP